jgi:hypothetical protein
VTPDRDGEGRPPGHTAEHATRATAEHALTSEFGTTATRATPLGGGTVRGGKQVGLRFYGVATLDHQPSEGSRPCYAPSTEIVPFRDNAAVVAPAP